MSELLKVENLHVNFHTYAGEVKAVRGVSFSLEKGEVLAIVGESGCGKTVTSKAIMRLLDRTSGEIEKESVIELFGKNMVTMSKRELNKIRGKDISMIFQDSMTSLNPTMTIGKQIMENILVHEKVGKQEAKRRALELLKLVEIPNAEERLNNYPHQMSGGMRQRAMIAVALACNPKVLIADEPTTALDVTIQAQLMDLLKNIQKKTEMAVILVTHDLAEAISMADRILILTSRPATVAKIIPVHFSLKERTPFTSRRAPEFKYYFNLIWKELQFYDPNFQHTEELSSKDPT